ncbi:MAG: hypothetical protein GQ507_03000 [Dehalococcoidales bacterium]|nr:hypothetical protein [Dehalococcoidales bacterium]
MKNSPLKVTCYSGHTYAERPKSFEWQGVTYEVDKIEKAWREPGIRLFQVKTLDNKRFRLYYDETDKQWSITELVGS